jgi:poly(3-hydroxybutyrate) depolymerase
MQAQDVLRFMYPGLNPPASGTLSGEVLRFNQRSFIHSALSSMANTGYVYVPASCYRQSCRVHVAFHGCEQGAAAIGDHFVARGGYNALADTNNIVVLYPQVEPSPLYPYNPKGCWDFWGYTSVNPFFPSFYAKNGVQMAAVMAMLQRLAAPRAGMAATAGRR